MARGGAWVCMVLLLTATLAAGQSPIAPIDLGPAPTTTVSNFEEPAGGLLGSPVMTRSGNPRRAINSSSVSNTFDAPPLPMKESARPSEIKPVNYDPPLATVSRAATLAPPKQTRLISQADSEPTAAKVKSASFDPLDELMGPKAKAPAKVTRDSGKFGDRIRDVIGSDKTFLCSDRDFESFASPVTNPFLFEDPRALTEIRPIFMYQKIPGEQPNFAGGNAWFFGTQARIAFTERISLSMTKIGLQSFNPGSTSLLDSQYGLSELHIGPKFTVFRDVDAKQILAAGAHFQIPVGSNKVFQDTGRLSIVPYVSYGQNLFRTGLGSFNVLGNTGYSISTNDQRSDFFYASGHVDFDIGDHHRFYPLMEANYFLYTTNGKANGNISGEGRDLANIGSMAKGSNMLSWAIGGRFKISESAQLGAAYEIPIFGNRDLFRYRFTVDLILRF